MDVLVCDIVDVHIDVERLFGFLLLPYGIQLNHNPDLGERSHLLQATVVDSVSNAYMYR